MLYVEPCVYFNNAFPKDNLCKKVISENSLSWYISTLYFQGHFPIAHDQENALEISISPKISHCKQECLFSQYISCTLFLLHQGHFHIITGWLKCLPCHGIFSSNIGKGRWKRLQNIAWQIDHKYMKTMRTLCTFPRCPPPHFFQGWFSFVLHWIPHWNLAIVAAER